MNFTLYKKTIRSKKERVSSLGTEPLMARIRDDAKLRATVEALRAEAPALPPLIRSQYLEHLPRICPGLDIRKRRNGKIVTTYNGVVLLEIKGLEDTSIVNELKRKAAEWPTTMAALTGASGRSIKILVRGTLTDGSLPTDEAQIERFHTKLYEKCAKVYATAIGHELSTKAARPKDVFLWTWDDSAYYAPEAAPIRINPQELALPLGEQSDNNKEYGTESVVPSTEKQRLYALRFALAVRQMRESIEGAEAVQQHPSNHLSDKEATLNYEEQLSLIAQNCAALGLPVEETILQSRSWYLQRIESKERARTIIESAYLSRPRKNASAGHTMQELTMELQAFMNERYDLRFNELSNGVEFRLNHSASYVFQPLDTRVMNTMIQEAHEQGIEVYDRDMKRFLGSTRVRNYNAARAYLNEVKDLWDGQKDLIGELADRVPNNNPHWREWFHTWFLGMVAQWEGYNITHGNAVVPLLIGAQGCGKSTFGQLILPPELRNIGYRELVDFSSKQDVERMLTTSLLINLDEFNQISEKIQQGFLKNLLQKSSVKGRRPYGSVVMEMPRMASFIATSNMNDVLNDPSGSRRFLVAEISEGQLVNTLGNIPYDSMYSQAYQELYNQHRRYYFIPEEVQAIEAHNARFANLRPEVSRFLEVFETTVNESADTRWLSVSEIANEVHRRTRFEYSNKSINYLGRWLTAEARVMHLMKKIRHGFAIYSVAPRK